MCVWLYVQGRAQEALTLLTAAIVSSPTYAEAHNNLGVLQRDVGAIPEVSVWYPGIPSSHIHTASSAFLVFLSPHPYMVAKYVCVFVFVCCIPVSPPHICTPQALPF